MHPVLRRCITTMASKILPCDTRAIHFPALDAAPQVSDPTTLRNLQTAAQALRSGSLVAFPTETVYGLGGSAVPSSDAIPKIYKAKGRPSDNPLIVHIAATSQLPSLIDPEYSDHLPQCYSALMERFWPGPLTILFPTIPSKLVSERATCGLTTVGIRMPAHPVARALLAFADVPVAAPSANKSGRPSPTQASHVDQDLRMEADLAYILDGGSCNVGLESTVVSALPGKGAADGGEKEILRVLRLGGISPEDIQTCLDEANLSQSVTLEYDSKATAVDKDFRPSTPGMKYKHYSPNAKVILLQPCSSSDSPDIVTFLKDLRGKKVGLLYIEPSALHQSVASAVISLQSRSLGPDHETQAQRLFQGLRSLDAENVDVILVECVEEEGLGRTVMERLRKAAGGSDSIAVRC